MKKLNFIIMLLLTACSSTLSSIGLFELNNQYEIKHLPDNLKVSSCEELKTKTYDVYHSEQTQVCIKRYKNIAEKPENQIKDEDTPKETLSKSKILLSTLKQYEKCKATDSLTVGELREKKVLISYYLSAYNRCSDSDIFDQDNLKKIVDFYKHFPILNNEIISLERAVSSGEARFGNLDKIDERFTKFLTTIDSHPILSKLQKTAPDFTKMKITAMNYECPLVYFVDSLNDIGSFINSDLASPSNYKFSKKGSDTLLMKVGDMEYTFIKSNNNIVNVAVITGKNKRGKLETSKNTFGNNWHAMEVCLQNQNMH